MFGCIFFFLNSNFYFLNILQYLFINNSDMDNQAFL